MNRNLLWMVAAPVAVALGFGGCEPSNPGAPHPNQPPDTRIVVAPMLTDSTAGIEHHPDHFVSGSDIFRVQWFGHDPDGRVAGFWVSVDGGAPVWTTRGDSLITFKSSQPDPNVPGRMRQLHTLTVTAQDQEGLRDPTPAERELVSVNYPPAITAFTARFPDSATVSPAIRFLVEWADPNPSGAKFRLSIDDVPVTDWDSRPGFQFCDTTDAELLTFIETGQYQPVNCRRLTAGLHTLKVEMRDLGEAAATPVTRTVTVIDTLRPAITSVTAAYGSVLFYPDYSVFHRPGRTPSFALAGVDPAFGEVVSFRYRLASIGADTAWQNWSGWMGASITLPALSPGEYLVELQCRNAAGAVSDSYLLPIFIAEPDFSARTLLIVDETRDGNGNPGSPNDAQVDDFYRNATAGLSGWTITELDYASTRFVSARHLYNQRIVLWHTDDRADFNLDENYRILSEYLNLGGRLILSGWDVFSAFEGTGPAHPFVTNYLRLAGAVQKTEQDFVGATGQNGYPDVHLDRGKVRATWTGMDKCWRLAPAHRAAIVAGWISASSDPAFEGAPAAVLNNSPAVPYRTLTLGFPLYFMDDAEAQGFITRAVNDLDL